jgi:cytochrome P450 family 619
MAKLIWAFEIVPKRDEDGNEALPETDPRTGYCEGFLVCANDFEADFQVRGEERAKTIMREFEESKDVFERFEATGLEKA